MNAKDLWRAGRIEIVLTYGLVGGAAIVAVVVLGEEAGRHIGAFEGWVASLGPWALVVALLLFALCSTVFVPDTLLGIFAGASFGFGQGLLVAAGGSLAGATLQYTLSRWLFKPAIDRALASRPSLAAIQVAVRRQEFKLQLLIRLTPINRALTSYVLGAAGVSFPRFLVACIALTPHLCLEVYFGYAGRHLAITTSQPAHAVLLHDVAMVAGLVVAVAVMVVVSRTARKAVDTATAPASARAPTR